jgi:hypothetical protein
MKNALDFIAENWLIISPVLLEGIVRLIPSKKNYSIIRGVGKLLDKIIPNLKKGGGVHIIILMLISFASLAQQNTPTKMVYSYNTTDTAFLQTTRTNIQAAYGNAGGLYFDNGRNKWRVWSGSVWTDLVRTSVGTVTNVTGTAPIAVATGTTTPVISMPAAASAQAGYVNTASQTFGGVKTLGSPVFTGIPVAPTAAPGTNTTQIATTAFVTAAIPATITASNGLQKIVNDIQVGGDANLTTGVNFNVTLTDDGASNAGMFAGNGGISLDPTGTPNQAGVSIVSGSAKLFFGLDDFNIYGNGAGAIFKDITASPKGIQYSSTGYVTQLHSLVDKEYADTKLDGTMVSTRVPFGVDGNTLKTDATGTFTYTEGASGYATINHARIGSPPWYGSVTYGIVSDNPAFGVNISVADGTVTTPTPFQATIYGGKAYTVGNNLGGDAVIASGLGNGTARSGNVIIDLGSSRGSLYGYLKILNIPTSSAGLPSGAVWSNAGVLTIVP